MSAGSGPLIVGHSHSAALFEAADFARVPFTPFSFWLEAGAVLFDGEHVTLSDTLRGHLATAPLVVSAVEGASYLVLALFASGHPFDFVAPWAPHLPRDPHAELVPADAISAVLRHADLRAMALLRALVAETKGDFVQVLPPPPVRQSTHENTAALYSLMGSLLGRPAPRAAGTEAEALRLWKLWRVMSEQYADFGRSLGIRVVPPPPATLDDEGFLRAEFAHDVGHGNRAYGVEVLRALGLHAIAAR